MITLGDGAGNAVPTVRARGGTRASFLTSALALLLAGCSVGGLEAPHESSERLDLPGQSVHQLGLPPGTTSFHATSFHALATAGGGKGLSAFQAQVVDTTGASTYSLFGTSYDVNRGYGTPTRLSQKAATFATQPVLDVTADSRGIVLWTELPASRTYDIAARTYDPTTGFGPLLAVGNSSTSQLSNPAVQMFSDGTALATWLRAGSNDVLAARFEPGVGFGSEVAVATIASFVAPQQVLRGSQSQLIVWLDGTSLFGRVLHRSGALDAPFTISSNAKSVQVARRGSSSVIAWEASGSRSKVSAANYDEGTGLGSSTVIYDEAAVSNWLVRINPSGEALLAWLARDSDGNNVIKARRGTAGGSFDAVTPVATSSNWLALEGADIAPSGARGVVWKEDEGSDGPAQVVRASAAEPGAATWTTASVSSPFGLAGGADLVASDSGNLFIHWTFIDRVNDGFLDEGNPVPGRFMARKWATWYVAGDGFRESRVIQSELGDATSNGVALLDSRGAVVQWSQTPDVRFSTPFPLGAPRGTDLVEALLVEPALDQDVDGVPNRLDNCTRTANPDQADVDHNGIGDACAPTSVQVSATAQLGRGTVLGARVQIGNGARLGEDVTVGDDTVIADNAVVGAGTTIGRGVSFDGTERGDSAIHDAAVVSGGTLGFRNYVGAGATIVRGFGTTLDDDTTVLDGAVVGASSASTFLGHGDTIGKRAHVSGAFDPFLTIGDDVSVANTDWHISVPSSAPQCAYSELAEIFTPALCTRDQASINVQATATGEPAPELTEGTLYNARLSHVDGLRQGTLRFIPPSSATYALFLGTPNLLVTVLQDGRVIAPTCTFKVPATRCAALRRTNEYALTAGHPVDIELGPSWSSEWVRLTLQ